MKKYSKLFIVFFLCSIFLTGCNTSKEEAKVYYLNFKPEVADVWEEIAELYTQETGVEVKILTAPSNGNAQTLKAEIAKRDAPTIFQINGPVEFEDWKNYCVDLSDTELYSWLKDKSMAISDETGVYGMPYVVEGYGIIYNDAIMQKYFSLASRSTKYKSMDEINTYAKLEEVVKDMTEHKNELGIQGVFGSTSFFKGEDWRWQTHLTNLPIYYEYKDKGVNDLETIDFSYGNNMKKIFDLYIDYSCTPRTELSKKTVADSMEEFALGKCAMVQNGNWAWTQIASVSGNTVTEDNCKYLPIYIGAKGEENQGLCIGTECYMCINNMVSEESQQASIDFIEWLYSSDIGKDYVTNKLQFITVFNTFSDEETPSNPLARQVSQYVSDESLFSVSWNFTTFPSQGYKDKLSEHLLMYINGEMDWSGVSKYVVDQWNAEKSGK
ncbi:MAG: ABC transporter substrate-binding protein [Lachnospiraceae bacterium]|nr:ABC transporter substrate-binding protein [Lachnospiraceae bacterium]